MPLISTTFAVTSANMAARKTGERTRSLRTEELASLPTYLGRRLLIARQVFCLAASHTAPADSGEMLSRMPLDLANDPSGNLPTGRLIAKAMVQDNWLAGRHGDG